jgi:hypothetical protein
MVVSNKKHLRKEKNHVLSNFKKIIPQNNSSKELDMSIKEKNFGKSYAKHAFATNGHHNGITFDELDGDDFDEF